MRVKLIICNLKCVFTSFYLVLGGALRSNMRSSARGSRREEKPTIRVPLRCHGLHALLACTVCVFHSCRLLVYTTLVALVAHAKFQLGKGGLHEIIWISISIWNSCNLDVSSHLTRIYRSPLWTDLSLSHTHTVR